MARTKTRRPRGQVKGWVQEAIAAGHKKAKEIKAYIKQTHNEVVSATQVYGVVKTLKSKKGRKKSSPATGAMPSTNAASAVTRNGAAQADAVSLILGVKQLAEKAGGMKKLKAVLEAMS